MGSRILVGTADGLHVIGGDGGRALVGKAVRALAAGEGALWAIAGGFEVVARRDGEVAARRDEEEWRSVGSVRDERANCLMPRADGLLIGLAGAHLARLDGTKAVPVESFESVPGRQEWYTPWGGPPDVRSMSQDGEGSVYVNVHVGGIPRSDDGGRSWQPTIDIDADVHQVLALPGTDQVLAAAAVGLAVSLDRGESWTVRSDGLDAAYCRAVAVCGDTVLVTASQGPGGGDAGVYRGRLGDDGPFERCEAGLPAQFPGNIDTYCLDANDELAAFGTAAGTVYASTDAGATWERVADGLPRVHCLLLDR